MAISNIYEQLRRDEGEVLHVYDDATGLPISKGSLVIGYPTIGIGRMVDKNKGGGISREEADAFLKSDVAVRRDQLASRLPWINSLNDARQGVLIGMAFQLGIGGLLGFKKTLEHIKNGHYVAAASEMLQSTWAKQTPERAERLATQMRTGVWQ